MRVLLAVAAMLIVIFAMRLAAPVVAPVCLAFILAIAFEPITEWMARRGVPRWVAALVTTLAVLAVVGGVGLIVLRAASDIIDGLPRYGAALASLEDDAAVWLEAHGLERVAASMGEVDASTRVQTMAEPVLWSTVNVLQTLILVVVTTAFIQVDAPGIRRAVAKRVKDPRRAARFTGAVDEIQRYVIVKGLLSAANGLLLGLWTAAWGVEGALLWGVLAFALNFVPVVGSLIAAVPPVLLGLMMGGPGVGLGVAAGYVAVNLIVDNVLEPRVMGRAVGISPLVVLLAMLFWGFVLGPIGALLSVPLTVVVKTGLATSPKLAWVAVLMDEVAAEPEDEPAAELSLDQSAAGSSSRRYNDRRSIPSTLAA
jgi:predicted PurR-regulated permease PerM